MSNYKQLSEQEMKAAYENYINSLCNEFRIVEKRAFSQKIANHIKNRPLDIEVNDLVKKDWNETFFAYVVKYSTYSQEELNNLFAIDVNILLSKIGMENGS